jgi:hypothetical protein
MIKEFSQSSNIDNDLISKPSSVKHKYQDDDNLQSQNKRQSTRILKRILINLPRHINQRKQMEKINRKKYENELIDKENQ